MRTFRSYEEAHDILALDGLPTNAINATTYDGILSLKLTEHPRSYHRILKGGQTIYYVGIGSHTTPGHPTGNHQWESQSPFIRSLKHCTIFPVLYKRYEGAVIFMGNYQVKMHNKKISNEGFTYYEFKLTRVNALSG